MTETATAGAAGATTPAGTAGSTTAATTTAATETAASAPGDAGFQLPSELADWGASKGYSKETLSTPEGYKMATSYREMEKLMGQMSGADKIVMPKDLADFKNVTPVLEKLGAPTKASDYRMEVPQGHDSAFATNASEWFAEARLLPAQAAVINQRWNEFASKLQQQSLESESNEGRESVTKLETEWAGDVKINSEIASRGLKAAAEAIGMDANRVEEIKNGNSVKLSAYEFAKLMKYVGDISKVSGDTFEGGDSKGGAGTSHTPESAKKEIDRLTNDPDFASRLLRKDGEAKKQLDALYKIAGQGVTQL